MDIFDIFAFIVFAVLGLAAVILIVVLGGLPGSIARQRGHPQAAAVSVAGWLGLVLIVLWPLALIWAFMAPGSFREKGGGHVISFLLIVYTALVVVLFKLKILKPRPVPIAAIIVLGVILLGGIVIVWRICAPISTQVVTSQHVVPIVPYVKGQVKKVDAPPNQPIRKGDLLLEIDPVPYQFTVDQLSAQLQGAKEGVNQAEAGLEAAKANTQKSRAAVTQALAAVTQGKASVADAQAGVSKAKAQAELAKIELDMLLAVLREDAQAVSKLNLAKAEQTQKAADATLRQSETSVAQSQAALHETEAALVEAQFAEKQAEAAARQAEFTLLVARSNVPALEAQLGDARFNLAECQVKAPGDGYVVNWQVRPGTMVTSMPTSPAGTFIDTSETSVVAVFHQNFLTNVRRGNEVELVLDPYPGRLFRGKVDIVIPATGEGQFTTGGTIPDAANVGSKGYLAVKITLTSDDLPPNLPLGAGGTVAIYTDHGKPFHIISKVAIRMEKWLLYVLPK